MDKRAQCCNDLDTKRELCNKCPHLDDCIYTHQNNISQTIGQPSEEVTRTPRQDNGFHTFDCPTL